MVHSNFLLWTALCGVLLLTLALASAFVQRLPISTSVIYFGVGCLIGPWGLDLLRLDMTVASPWLEHLTELGVTLSLFIGGLRLRLSPRHRAWRAAYRLASAVMLVSIAGVAWVADQWLGLDPPTAHGALGFLAIFGAGISLRSAKITTLEESPHPEADDPSVRAHPPAETLVAPNVVTPRELEEPAVAAGVLVAEVFHSAIRSNGCWKSCYRCSWRRANLPSLPHDGGTPGSASKCSRCLVPADGRRSPRRRTRASLTTACLRPCLAERGIATRGDSFSTLLRPLGGVLAK